MAVVEAVMKLVKFYVNTSWLPLMNVVVAEAVVLGAWHGGLILGTPFEAVYAGLVLGLVAGGFYELRKASGVPF